MRWLGTIILLTFLGCTTDQSSCYRMTESGYPAVHRNDYVYRNAAPHDSAQCQQGGYYCTHKCHHIKEPTYQYRFVPPVYKPIFLGVDEEGHDIYERMLITGSYYEKVFAGYHCYLCGAKL